MHIDGKLKHAASLSQAKPYYDTDLGKLRRVTADDLPILKNMSLKSLILKKNGSTRVPHWHANCNELGYVKTGKLLISILDSGNEFSVFTVTAGEMFHIKTGSLHCIENISDEEADILIAFRHELPKDFDFAASSGAFSDAVLGNTFDLPSSAFAKISRNTESKYVVHRKGKPTVPSTAYLPNSHKFDVEGIRNGVESEIGYAKQAKSQYWPALTDIAMYSLGVKAALGMREVHWHPFTAEMGYVNKGSARMTVMDPDGSKDTYILKQGDVYFIPAAYPHQIEVIGEEDIHFLIFFDNAMPGDVGFRTSTTLFSREVLAATFEIPIEDLPEFPYVTKDPLLVKVINPVDPVEAEDMGQ